MNNHTYTENGAKMLATSGSSLLDMNFKLTSYRNRSEDQILQDFEAAYNETPELAVKWLFYAGDIRNGGGERRVFRTILPKVIERHPHLIRYVGEFNRFDSLLCLLDTGVREQVLTYIVNTLTEDANRVGSCSLMAKWMPSINCNSDSKRRYARMIAQRMYGETHDTYRKYRKLLSGLREQIDVVERKMCKSAWSDINYKTMPGRAFKKYKKAFAAHDGERYKDFIDRVLKGHTTMHSGTVSLHEMVCEYRYAASPKDDVEAMWKSYPNFVRPGHEFITVCDVSGSMTFHPVGGSNAYPIDVAMGLSVYMAQHITTPALANKIITFTSSPTFIDIGSDKTLFAAIKRIQHGPVGYDTNIEAVFDCYLNALVTSNTPTDAVLPGILMLSDMEFNNSSVGGDRLLFTGIERKFAKHGYKLPKLVFWNIMGRTDGVPARTLPNGVVLMSGFNPTILDLVYSDRTDPMEILAEKLNSERYACITLEP